MVRIGAAALGASWFALTALAAAQAPAEDPRDARIRELEARVDQLAARLDALTGAAPAAVVAAVQPAQSARVTVDNGRPVFRAPDDSFRVAVRGLMQFDAATYNQEDAAAPDLSAGANFRRARLGVEGTAFSDWNYNLIFEFGGSGTEDPGEINAAWLEYDALGPFAFRIGAFAPLAGLDDAISSSESLFLERGAAVELARGIAGGDGRAAAGLYTGAERWVGSLALTGGLVGADPVFDEQTAIVARAAALVLEGEHHGLHLGANVSHVMQLPDTTSGAGPAIVRLRERPELRVDGTRLVDSGDITADKITVSGLEAAFQWHSLFASAEAVRFDVERPGALESAAFGGWHVQAAYSLTGETRIWDEGGFGGARPAERFDPAAGHWGGWEIAGRYSVLDLNDNEAAFGPSNSVGAPNAIIRGGEQEIVTLGLNWRPHALVRFMLNYQRTDIDRLDVLGEIEIGQTIDALSLRSQVAF